MTLKCYNKPNRTKPRHFSACDAARIAREVVKDDDRITPEMVMACIAKGFGFTHVSIERGPDAEPTVVAAQINLTKSVGVIKVVVEGLQKIATALRLSQFSNGLAKIIVFLDSLADALDLIFDSPQQEPVDDVLPEGFCQCKKKEV